MTLPTFLAVHHPGVALMCQRARQTIGGLGNQNQVDVVRHQAIGDDVDPGM